MLRVCHAARTQNKPQLDVLAEKCCVIRWGVLLSVTRCHHIMIGCAVIPARWMWQTQYGGHDRGFSNAPSHSSGTRPFDLSGSGPISIDPSEHSAVHGIVAVVAFVVCDGDRLDDMTGLGIRQIRVTALGGPFQGSNTPNYTISFLTNALHYTQPIATDLEFHTADRFGMPSSSAVAVGLTCSAVVVVLFGPAR